MPPKRLTYPETKGYRHLAIKTTNIEEDRNYLISQGVKVGKFVGRNY